MLDVELGEDYDDDTLFEALAKLREPIPPDQVEKKPTPMWKGAWDDKRKSQCDECGGYHVTEHCVHLDYFGHAKTTGRILDIDPLWDWEPLAYDEDGLPKFDRHGGLWIKLTICGVTRKGYGTADNRAGGNAVKEIIGDAIRNAAMRFGVALELWTKGEMHDAKNPEAQVRVQRTRVAGGRSSRRPAADSRTGAGADAPRRAFNQDALDSLASVCDENGLDQCAVRQRYIDEHEGNDVVDASPDAIYAFAQKILEECSAEPDADSVGVGDPGDPVQGPDDPAAALGAGGGEGDSEAQDGPLF